MDFFFFNQIPNYTITTVSSQSYPVKRTKIKEVTETHSLSLGDLLRSSPSNLSGNLSPPQEWLG